MPLYSPCLERRHEVERAGVERDRGQRRVRHRALGLVAQASEARFKLKALLSF